jgi:hypothetical protein
MWSFHAELGVWFMHRSAAILEDGFRPHTKFSQDQTKMPDNTPPFHKRRRGLQWRRKSVYIFYKTVMKSSIEIISLNIHIFVARYFIAITLYKFSSQIGIVNQQPFASR